MSNQLPIALVAGLFAGGVGAFATSALTPSKAPAAGSSSASALDPAGDLGAQVKALAETNALILERLERVEASAAMGAPIQVRMPAQLGNEPIDLDAAVAAALAKLNSAPNGTLVTPDFRKQVETVLEIREEEERLAREQDRVAREAKALEDRLARLQTDLGLDTRQVDGMRKVFLESDTKREEMRNAMRDGAGAGGGDFEAMRTQWQTLATAMNTQIQGILTPSQYEQYQATNPDRGFGGRGGFGGPGAGAGGGNNGGGNNAGGGNAGGGNNGGRRRGGNAGGGNGG